MPLVPLPRAALVLFGSMAIAAILLKLFSYEFSVPTESVGGIAITAFPKVDVVVLSQAPSDAWWLSLGDEWGGSQAHLRSLLIRSGLLIGGTFIILHFLVLRRPRVASWILLAVASGSFICCAMSGLTRAWANYETHLFFFSFTCCVPRAVEIIGRGVATPHPSLAVSESAVDLLGRMQETFEYTLTIVCIALFWALYSRSRSIMLQ